MSPNDHDFEWVEARHNCSIRVEFEKLRRDVEKATEQHKNLTLDDARFEFHDEGDLSSDASRGTGTKPRPCSPARTEA